MMKIVVTKADAVEQQLLEERRNQQHHLAVASKLNVGRELSSCTSSGVFMDTIATTEDEADDVPTEDDLEHDETSLIKSSTATTGHIVKAS